MLCFLLGECILLKIITTHLQVSAMLNMTPKILASNNFVIFVALKIYYYEKDDLCACDFFVLHSNL